MYQNRLLESHFMFNISVDADLNYRYKHPLILLDCTKNSTWWLLSTFSYVIWKWLCVFGSSLLSYAMAFCHCTNTGGKHFWCKDSITMWMFYSFLFVMVTWCDYDFIVAFTELMNDFTCYNSEINYLQAIKK